LISLSFLAISGWCHLLPYRDESQRLSEVDRQRKGKPSPFAFSELLSTSAVTFGILESITSGQPIAIENG
jgi:hypothetical protein